MKQDSLRYIGADNSLLIVDDDEVFRMRLARAMEKRGFAVTDVSSVSEGQAFCTATPPAYAVIDLRLGDGSGRDVLEALQSKRPVRV